jgi:predicted kinase
MGILELLGTDGGREPAWDELFDRLPPARGMSPPGGGEAGGAGSDPAVNARLVHQALRDLPEYGDLPLEQRQALDLAALLHAVGEPQVRYDEDGRVRGPGASILGAIRARRLLWEEGISFRGREAACALIRFQHLPFRLGSGPVALKRLLSISVASRCNHVALLARAKATSGLIGDRGDALAAVARFSEEAERHGCLEKSFNFPSPHSRFLYFRREDRNPYYEAHDDTRGEIIILAGLPGAGKSTWIATHAPEGHELIGLDEMRVEMGIRPDENQGPVVQATKERAKRILGARSGPESIVWNATNLSRRRRDPILALCENYRYRARIVYIEVPPGDLDRQNHERERPVPADVIRRMMMQWELPDRTEAHAVEYHVRT